MTNDNATSRAVEAMGRLTEDMNYGGCFLGSRKATKAVAEKFRFMERTLVDIVNGKHSRDLRQIHVIAQEALAFDPLQP